MVTERTTGSSRPLRTAIAAGLLAAGACLALVLYAERLRRGSARAAAAAIGADQARLLVDALEHPSCAAEVLAMLVRQGRGEVRDFDLVAGSLLELYPDLVNLQLAPGGVTRQVFPLAGNEAVLGLDQLHDPLRRRESLLARDTGRKTLAGPFPLLQGGAGVVVRQPVFLEGASGRSFWGFAVVVLRLPGVLQTAGLERLAGRGLAYRLWRAQPDAGAPQVIAASGQAPPAGAVSVPVRLANAGWILEVGPARGWGSPLALALEVLASLLACLAAAYAGWRAAAQGARRRELARLVDERTTELRQRVADLTRAEAALRDSEFFFRESQRAASIGSYKADLAAGRWESSEVLDAIFGIGPDHPRTVQGWLDLVHEEDRAELGRYLAEEVVGARRPFDREYRIVRRSDGAVRWVYGRGQVRGQDAAGRATMLIGTIQDVTERIRLEERVRQAEKMDAVGQLAGGIAHDFNNQLTGVLGFADLLVERLDDPRLKGYAEDVRTAAGRAADLTRQLLAFARKGKYQEAPVDMHRVVGEVAGLLARSIDKRIAIRRRLEAAPPTVLGDQTQLQNAILNLALNARDAMPQGGELVFSTAVEDLPSGAPPDGLAPGRYLRIGVADTGVGMDAATRKRLFEPFFTTKGVGKGTGLGLASVYGTVKNHRGAVRVRSAPGQGSAFDLLLPLLEAPREERPAPAPAAPPGGTGRILLVDDEPVVLALAREMLRGLGYEVLACPGSAEALAAFRREPGGFDLVILDMVMPGLGGRDLFRALREARPGVRVLLSSGYSLDGEAQEILDQGVLGFLQKPYTLEALARAVAAARGGAP